MTSQAKFSAAIDVIKCDLRSRNQSLSVKCMIKDPITRFHFYLRLTEHFGRRRPSLLYLFFKWRFLSLSSRLGFSIPENTLGKGVYLPHYGTIVVNSKSFVGDHSVLNVDVVIGRHPCSKESVPTIGKGVFIGPGAKIFGDVSVGDCSVIGANSVLTKDLPRGVLGIGAPAQIKRPISQSEYHEFIVTPEAWSYWQAPEVV